MSNPVAEGSCLASLISDPAGLIELVAPDVLLPHWLYFRSGRSPEAPVRRHTLPNLLIAHSGRGQ